MTREEREKCNTQRWARSGPSLPRLDLDLDLDPNGRYVENKEPVLSRRPTNGCRARITGAVDPMGNSAGAAGGATCVIPF